MSDSSLIAEPDGFRLEIVEGPDLGRVHFVAASRLTASLLGRTAVCELRLTDPRVSSRHLLLEVVEGGLQIRDLRSVTGTYVNGVRVREATLRGNERVIVGASTLLVVARHAPPERIEHCFGRIIGASFAMRRLYPALRKLAASAAAVILEGEVGVGKGLVARVLHERSPRAAGPFVVHDAGAREGLAASFARARGGTLFLEKLGSMDASVQAALHVLLRSLEDGDVRVIGTAERDLMVDVEAGRFREDVYHRLAASHLRLPPLRERAGDVRLLAAHFWKQAGAGVAGPPEELLSRLEAYAWPGNVRELVNSIAHYVSFGELAFMASFWRSARTRVGEERTSERSSGDLVSTIVSEDLPFHVARDQVLRQFERKYIESMIARHGGNVAKAARAAGVARRYFYALRNRSR